jgi:isopenicillin N synthase-like dioxygenase
MLMRWTNDRLKATLHKVETPPSHDTTTTKKYPERFSIAFFCNANKDVELECLEQCCSSEQPARYPPINAHRYITQRLLDTINS